LHKSLLLACRTVTVPAGIPRPHAPLYSDLFGYQLDAFTRLFADLLKLVLTGALLLLITNVVDSHYAVNGKLFFPRPFVQLIPGGDT